MKPFLVFVGQLLKDQVAVRFLIFLLVVDLGFFALHFLRYASVIKGYDYSIEADGGYAEIFQYLKEIGSAVLLIGIYLKKRDIAFWIWILMFSYLFLDYSLRLHEYFGDVLVEFFNIQPALGLRADDFGEMLTVLLIGLVFLPVIIWAYLHASANFQLISKHLLAFICLLFVLGVVVDMFNSLFRSHGKIAFLLSVVEDGGEMIVMTAIISYFFWLYRNNGKINCRDSK